MNTVVVSYKFLYYSLYRYYLTQWEYSSGWPQGWAVVAISMLIMLVVSSVELHLVSAGHEFIAGSRFLNWMPSSLRASWAFLLALLANGYYFLMDGRWSTLAEKYGKLPDNVLRKSHWISCAIVFAVIIIYFIEMFTFK